MTASTLTDTNAIACPKCGGQMWDNRKDKKNPKAPDFKCQNRACEGVIWPPKIRHGQYTEKATPKPVSQGHPAFLHNAEAEDNAELAGKIGPAKKPTMREAYKQLTEWVLTDIQPLYKGWELNAETVAAITATLFIQACQSGKVE